MKVTINGNGREVTIEAPDTNVSYNELADKALSIWSSATPSSLPGNGTYGFQKAPPPVGDRQPTTR